MNFVSVILVANSKVHWGVSFRDRLRKYNDYGFTKMFKQVYQLMTNSSVSGLTLNYTLKNFSNQLSVENREICSRLLVVPRECGPG